METDYADKPLVDIVERAKIGDHAAFDQFVTRFETTILKTAFHLLRNPDDARDVAQEVYVKILRSFHTCRDTGRIEHWIYRITVNTARDFLRRRRFFLPLEKIVRSVRPRDPVLRSEIRGRLDEALDMLSFNERTVFVFRALEEMETPEVARILGCREVTVRSHLHNARKKLRKHLRDFEDMSWTD
jgi:RNA polymerase sigma-70 factor (ECF subfamily)